ncbi:MAG: DUF3499 family protein [Actinomycetota bacterium]|nr:DUF3499 family protein [Actinomycetota bacterium]
MNAVTERQVGGDRASAVDPILTRTCARPACSAPAAATLAFFYGAREVSLEKLGLDEMPSTYDLCATHADRMRPPYGWAMNDRRRVAKSGEATPHSAEQQGASSSVADATQTATDASSPFRWLGVAVQATVAFYPPDSEAFDDLPAVESVGEASPFEPESSEASLLEPGSDEVSLFESGSSEAVLFESGSSEASLFEPGPDEAALFEPGLSEALPEEVFVPVRARSW